MKKHTLMDKIRDAITASDKTHGQICRETGMTPPHLSKVVHGERGVSVEVLEKIAECLGLEVVLRPKGKGRRKGKG